MIAEKLEGNQEAATLPQGTEDISGLLDVFAARPDKINRLALLNYFSLAVANVTQASGAALAEHLARATDPVAAVRAKDGDPEAFAERELEILDEHALQQIPSGTLLYAGAPPAFVLADDKAMLARYSAVEQHGLSRANLSRLAEIGVLRHIGMGTYSITTFGFYVLGREFVTLPLKPVVEYRR